MRDKENKGETIAFRISGDLYDSLTEIARDDRRKLSDVARGLLERGYASFLRDGLIFEPGPPQRGGSDEEQMPAEEKHGQSRATSKKRLAGQQPMKALDGGNKPEVVKVDPDGTMLVRGRAREVKFADPPKRASRA